MSISGENKYGVEITKACDQLEEWDDFVDRSPQGCIFCRSWWLDVVCPKGFEILILRKGGRIVAGMPMFRSRTLGHEAIHMPKLTQTLGVLLAPPTGRKYETRLSNEMAILRELVRAIPPVDHFNMNFHHTFTNWLPFYWAGYEQTTSYTYIIDDLSDLDRVFQNFKSNIRGKIRKAEGIIKTITEGNIEEFYLLNRMTFERQNLRIPYSLEFVRKIDDALRQHKSRKIFVAVDAQGRHHSSLYLIWDERTSHVHMVGEGYGLRPSGSGILLVWEAIKFTKEILGLNQFDFEGSMIESIEPVRRGFGARQTPYFRITKTSLARKAWQTLRPYAARLACAFRFRR